jgi:hypothetical protein
LRVSPFGGYIGKSEVFLACVLLWKGQRYVGKGEEGKKERNERRKKGRVGTDDTVFGMMMCRLVRDLLSRDLQKNKLLVGGAERSHSNA